MDLVNYLQTLTIDSWAAADKLLNGRVREARKEALMKLDDKTGD